MDVKEAGANCEIEEVGGSSRPGPPRSSFSLETKDESLFRGATLEAASNSTDDDDVAIFSGMASPNPEKAPTYKT